MWAFIHIILPGTTYPIDAAIVSYSIKQQPLRDTATHVITTILPVNDYTSATDILELPFSIITPSTCPHGPSCDTSQTTRKGIRERSIDDTHRTLALLRWRYG